MPDIDGNTAALNEYLDSQSRRELDAEIRQDDVKEKIKYAVLGAIDTEDESVLEALSTEATLAAVNKFEPKFKAALIESIECEGSKAEADADRMLGKLLRTLAFDYIAQSFR